MNRDASEPSRERDVARVETSLQRLGAMGRRAGRFQATRAHLGMQPAGLMVFRAVILGEPISVAGIIAETGADKSVVSRQLRDLRQWGLVQMQRSEEDARMMIVRATPVGRERAEEVRSALRRRFHDALREWNEDEIETLAEMLDRLVPALAEHDARTLG